jgi:hypothetical protein
MAAWGWAMSADPIRLLDDPQIEDQLRSALRQLEHAPPQPFDLEAGLARFRSAMAAPMAPAPPRIPKHVAWSLGAAGAAGLLVVAALALRGPKSTPHPEPAAAPSPSAVATVAAPAQSAVEIELDEAVDGASRAHPQPAAVPTSTDDLIRREVQHLAEVKRALSSNPAEALRLAEQGHKDFARGMLYQEREAAAVRALVRLGRGAEARARAARFVKRFPRSPYAEQLARETGLPL